MTRCHRSIRSYCRTRAERYSRGIARVYISLSLYIIIGSLFIYHLRFSNLEKCRKNLSKLEYFHKNLRILLKTCIFAGFLCGSTPTKLDINTHPSTLHLECFLCEKHTRYLFFRIQLNIKINNQSLINHAKDEVLDTLHLC